MEIRWNQSDFSAGQFDPKVYARDDYVKYYKAAKNLNNSLIIPQGGAQRRWGSGYVDALTETNPAFVQTSTLTYDDSAIYLLVFEDLSLKIYLEDILVATVVSPYAGEDVQGCQFTQVQNRIIISNENYNPYQLSRGPGSNNAISAISTVNDTLTLTTPITADVIYPVQFNTAGSLPGTYPQIFAGRTYFVRSLSTTTVQIYASSDDAYYQRGAFQILTLGSSSNIVILNSWTLSSINFINEPAYDFDSGYSAITFTPSAVSGDAVVITASAAIFTAAMVGGVYSGNLGSLRIQIVTDATHITGYTTEPFADTSAIEGAVSFLGEPAWSASRGYPRAVSFWQSRLVFGGSPSISNGVWLSVVNQAFDFDDSTLDDDAAISWYPSSGGPSYIRAITSARTLLIHTNNGTYSTSVSSDTPATPRGFNLIEQNKDGVSAIQPIFIDNQIIYIDKSGNNAKNLIFDIIQGAYTLNNISVTSSNLINHPVDVAPLTEPNFTDGAYVIFVNADGTLGIFQTLIEQNIAAWSPATTYMSDGTQAYYTHIASSINDCWFIVKRRVNGSDKLYIERADFDTNMDCTKFYFNLGSDTVTGLSYLEGETVYILADGYLLPPQVVSSGQITLPDTAQTVQVGLNFESIVTLLPIGGIPQTPANLYKPMHIRGFYVSYYETVGGTLSGAQIQTVNLQDVILNAPVVPQSGVKEIKLMGGWDTKSYEISIKQTLPLPMTIRGVGYILEIP